MRPLTRDQIAGLLAAASAQGFDAEQITALSADLDRKHVRTRDQAGRRVAYIEGWHAEAEANRIFGFGGWSSETVHTAAVAEGQRKIGKVSQRQGDRPQRDGFGVSYIARVRVTVHAGERTIIREGVGSGHGIDVDRGQAHESAIKEAETDARKRALKTFGNVFGLALYDKQQRNVSDGAAETQDQAPIEQKQKPAVTPAVTPAKAGAAPAKPAPAKAAVTPTKPAPAVTPAKAGAALAGAEEKKAATLLDGDDRHIGLRAVCTAYRNARDCLKDGRDMPKDVTAEELDASFRLWESWRTTLWPKLSAIEQGKILKALEAYEKLAKSFDQALSAAEAGADLDTGELRESV